MQYTDNYSLRKPQMAETASVSDINYNTDRIDAIMADNRQLSVDMYVSGNTYNTGDLVGYENPSTHHIKVYRCLVDNVTGVWDSTKWAITNLADEVIAARASGGTEVKANPSGTPTDTMNTVEIDGVVYAVGGDSANQNIADEFSTSQTYAVGDYCIYESILYKCTTAISTAGAWDSTKWTSCVVTDEMGQGGGGTTVIANPSGTATDDLTKIQIGNTIYDVSGGGGTGGNYTETTLWSGSTTASTLGDTITLSESIRNFDAINIICGGDGATWLIPALFLTSELVTNGHYVGPLNGNMGANWFLLSDTSIKITSMSSGTPVTYTKVVGIKFGGSSEKTQTILYTATTMTDTEINVDLTAYDEYIIYANDTVPSVQMPQGNSFPKSVFQYVLSMSNPNIILYGYYNAHCDYTVASNKLTFHSNGGNYRIVMIVGIK